MELSDLIKFLTSRVFWKNLAIGIISALCLLFVVLVMLRFYTRHGEALSVPDLKGFTLQQADSSLKLYHLKMKVIDSVFIKDAQRGTVIEQNPNPGIKVKEGRTIFITMNANNPEKILMPNVKGVTLRQAVAILENHGLVVGQLSYVFDIAVNNVLEQRFEGTVLEDGDSIIRGSSIDLVLGKGLGDGQGTSIPQLVNLSLYRAKSILATASLNISAVNYDNSVLTAEDSAQALIFKQDPAYDPNNSIPLGSYIDVWLSVDPAKFEDMTLNDEEMKDDEK